LEAQDSFFSCHNDFNVDDAAKGDEPKIFLLLASYSQGNGGRPAGFQG
jgi:hypothetical protein